jgi:hypothetical protein
MLSGLSVDRAHGRIEAWDFSFSKGALRVDEIFDSATSPPARYVIELARRIAANAPDADLLVIANPLLPVKAEQLATWLQAGIKGPLLLSDKDNFPLLYCLPASFIAEHERFLLMLSTVDAGLDHRLLEGLMGAELPLLRLNNLAIGPYPVSTPTGWFQGGERQKLMKVTTANAIKIIETRDDWRSVPVAAYHPYHAGSIVFFAMASRDVEAPLVERQVVCSSYRDIVSFSGSKLAPIWLKLPFLPRDNSVGEPQYFVHALDRLGEEVLQNNFLVFMRYSRSTGTGPFHRIDQDRFSLGQSFDRPDQLRQMQLPLVRDQCGDPTEPLKILFHITGGVPIKNYPLDYCKVVMRALRDFGIVPSVIGRPDLEPYGAISIDADETDLLTAAVRRHHLFVGLDSFPHHYVKNVLGWPTIGMFGTTGAGNFGGGWNSHYRALDAALACHPCGAEQTCPVFRGSECLNYIKPEALIAAILEMAEQIYGFTVSD